MSLTKRKDIVQLDSLTQRIGKYLLNKYLSESNKISYIKNLSVIKLQHFNKEITQHKNDLL